MNQINTIELYDRTKEGWYISLKRTEWDCNGEPFYDIEKANPDDGRSKSSIQISEEELQILLSLIKEMKGGKE